MPPKPTTALPTSGVTIVEPHAESHESGGSDPVLGALTVLATTTISSSWSTTSTSLSTITGSSTTFTSRGGTLLILATLNLEITRTAGGESVRGNVLLDIDGTNYQSATIGAFLDANTAGLTIRSPGSSLWHVTDVGSGPHTLILEGAIDGSEDAGTLKVADGNYAVIVVFELNPLRRS